MKLRNITQSVPLICCNKVRGLATLSVHSRRVLAYGLIAVLLGLLDATFAMAAPPELPPLTRPLSHERHVGKVILVELVTPDLAAAKRFYGGLFGWTFNDFKNGGIYYTQASLDDVPVAGLVQRTMPAGPRRQPAWLTFISVRDVDAAANIATRKGAKILFGPASLPDRGREAVLADPQGAVFAMLDSNNGDPPDELPAAGNWIWSSLLTSDADKAAAFYQDLFDYEVFDVSASEGVLNLLLGAGDHLRASANTFPANHPNGRPHWLHYVRVNDAAQMAAKVVTLGGSVLLKPRPDRHGGMIAIVADPLGAPFGLLEWTENSSDEVNK